MYCIQDKWDAGGQPTTEPSLYPNGWLRFGLNTPAGPKPPLRRLYHGTDIDAIPLILNSALKPGQAQEGAEQGCRAVFLTPSTEYAASPRYARGVGSDGFSEVRRCSEFYIQCDACWRWPFLSKQIRSRQRHSASVKLEDTLQGLGGRNTPNTCHIHRYIATSIHNLMTTTQWSIYTTSMTAAHR